MSASGSNSNCNGTNPQVSFSSTQYVANSQYTINGTHTFDGQTLSTSDSLTTPNASSTITNVVYEQIASDNLPIDMNPNTGGGLRIFPDKKSPNDTVNRKVVRIKATISPMQPDIEVFFKNFDLDDLSANTAPIDDDAGTSATLQGVCVKSCGNNFSRSLFLISDLPVFSLAILLLSISQDFRFRASLFWLVPLI